MSMPHECPIVNATTVFLTFQTRGVQPIHVAAAMGHIAIIKKLVEQYHVSVESATLVSFTAVESQ